MKPTPRPQKNQRINQTPKSHWKHKSKQGRSTNAPRVSCKISAGKRNTRGQDEPKARRAHLTPLTPMKQRPNLTLPSPKLEVYLPDRSMLTERRTPHTKCSSTRDTQGYSGFGWAWFGGGDTRVAPSGIGGWREFGIRVQLEIQIQWLMATTYILGFRFSFVRCAAGHKSLKLTLVVDARYMSTCTTTRSRSRWTNMSRTWIHNLVHHLFCASCSVRHLSLYA